LNNKLTLRKRIFCIHAENDSLYLTESGCNTNQSICLHPFYLESFLELLPQQKLSFRLIGSPSNRELVVRLLDYYKDSVIENEIWLANPIRFSFLTSSIQKTLNWLRQPIPILGTVGDWFRVRDKDRSHLEFLNTGELKKDHPCVALLNYCGARPYFDYLLGIINDPRWFASSVNGRALFRYLGLNREAILRVLDNPLLDDPTDRCRVAFRAWFDRDPPCDVLPKESLDWKSAVKQTKIFLSLIMRWWTGAQDLHPETYFYSFGFFQNPTNAEEFRKKVGSQQRKKVQNDL